jgi:hypothetical protein
VATFSRTPASDRDTCTSQVGQLPAEGEVFPSEVRAGAEMGDVVWLPVQSASISELPQIADRNIVLPAAART